MSMEWKKHIPQSCGDGIGIHPKWIGTKELRFFNGTRDRVPNAFWLWNIVEEDVVAVRAKLKSVSSIQEWLLGHGVVTVLYQCHWETHLNFMLKNYEKSGVSGLSHLEKNVCEGLRIRCTSKIWQFLQSKLRCCWTTGLGIIFTVSPENNSNIYKQGSNYRYFWNGSGLFSHLSPWSSNGFP